MQTIEGLISATQIIAAVIIVLLVLSGIIGLYFMKIYKSKVKEKILDYSRFVREDTVEYAKFDDVGDHMIITNGKKRFVAGITCSGCDFRDMEEDEQLQVIRGYLSFINVLDNQNIQYWQMAEDVDLDKMIGDYKKKFGQLQENRYLLTLDYEELKRELEAAGAPLEGFDDYYQKLRNLQRQITSLGYQINQLEVQLVYLESISGEKADPHLEQVYFFDWLYNPLNFTQELTEADIYEKAEKQLNNKANAYISALRNAGVKARMLTGTEILAQMRRYTHPISAAKYRVEDILKSAYDSIAVTSNSLRDAEEKVNQNMLKNMTEVFSGWEKEGQDS